MTWLRDRIRRHAGALAVLALAAWLGLWVDAVHTAGAQDPGGGYIGQPGVVGVDVEAWSAELDAVAGLSATGLATRTADDTWTVRTLTGPAAGITVSNGDGVSGNPTLALANDLAALEGLAANTGVAVRTAADTWTTRTIASSSSGLVVTNGDGVAGAPSFALDADLQAISALASAADKVPYATGAQAWALADFTATGRAIVDDASMSAVLATIGTGTNSLPLAAFVNAGAQGDFVCRTSSSGGAWEDCTSTQATARLDTATTSLKGVVKLGTDVEGCAVLTADQNTTSGTLVDVTEATMTPAINSTYRVTFRGWADSSVAGNAVQWAMAHTGTTTNSACSLAAPNSATGNAIGNGVIGTAVTPAAAAGTTGNQLTGNCIVEVGASAGVIKVQFNSEVATTQNVTMQSGSEFCWHKTL